MKLKTTTQLFPNLSKLDSRMELAEREMRSSKLSISKLSSLLVLLFLSYLPSFYAQTETFSTAGTYTWVCPYGVTSVTVQCWGGGGGGGFARSTNSAAGGGGGGGAFATSVITVTPGASYTVVVGAGGSGGAANGTVAVTGGVSSFNTNSVIAAGGNGGTGASTATGGSAGSKGLAASCTTSGSSQASYNGGNGAAGTGSSAGGGGGSSAGTSIIGNAGSGATAGTAPTGGGAGGAGKSSSSGNGVAGSNPGGGGGGAYKGSSGNYSGGDGGAGKVVLTYEAYLVGAAASITVCSGAIMDPGGRSNYGASATSTTTIYPGTVGNKVKLSFLSFGTEDGYDYLYVYNGNSVSAAQVSGSPFTGSSIPTDIISSASDGSLTLKFYSDVSNVGTGFEAGISCLAPCSGTPNNGTIATVSTLSGLAGQNTVALTSSGLTDAIGITYNWQLSIDGGTTYSDISGATSTTYTATPYQTSSYRLKTTCSNSSTSSYSNVISYTATGFVLPLTGVTSSITTCSGTIYDPGGTGDYGTSSTNTSTIYPGTVGNSVKLTFSSFNTEATYDYLYVYNGNSTSASQVLGSPFNGTSIPSAITSTALDGSLTLKFTSDISGVRAGFEGTISCITACTSPVTQATSFTYSSIAEQSMTLGWTRGNGNNVMIVAKAGSAPTDPTSGTSYTANAAYASGTACGGGYVVYSGTGTSVNLTGLTGGTTYYFAAYEYNTTGTCYNTTELTGSSATLNQETWIGVTSTNWNVGTNWSSGYVPTSSTNVTIPSGTPYAPTISASAYAVCKNLTINSSATLTENAPGVYYFAIYGNITCNGTFISNGLVELNGGLISDYATISGTGDMSSLNLDLGYDVNVVYYKLLNDITLEQFYLDSYLGNSIFDMNGYNLTAGFFDVESSTTFYQKTGILYIEDDAASINNTSFVESTGTTYFSGGTVWLASSQIIPSITYYNLKVRTNNTFTATIGDGSSLTVTGDLTILNPSTAGGTATLGNDITVTGNTNLGTTGNALNFTLNYRITGTGTFTMGNVAAHAINISYASASNFALTCSGAPIFYGTVTYTSASAQKVITATTYNNLTFALAGTKTLFGNLDVNGNLTLTAGTFDVSTFNVSLAGDLVKQSAATLTANTATFSLDGTATQYVNVTAAAGNTACDADITFYNLIIDGTDVKLYYNKTNNRKYNTNDFTVNSGKQVSFISQ